MPRRQTRPAIERFRLDRGWTYERLTIEIAKATGLALSVSTVSKVCRRLHPPRATTQYAIDKFLELRRADASQEVAQ